VTSVGCKLDPERGPRGRLIGRDNWGVAEPDAVAAAAAGEAPGGINPASSRGFPVVSAARMG